MQRVFEDFVDCLFASTNQDSLHEAMANVAASLDLPFFAYLSVPRDPDPKPILISSYPRPWTTHYLQNRYEHLDPVILRASRSLEPFEWGLGAGPITLSKDQQRLFDEAAQFDIRYGLTIPVHRSGDGTAAVTFAAGEQYPAFERRVLRQGRLLQLIAFCLHAHVRRRLIGSAMEGISLSPRERECMKWAAEGKSHWEIGRILNISHHTVAYHLDNAKAKLGVKTNIQAVVAFTSRRIS